MAEQYDNTNTAIVFPARDETIYGHGRININGKETGVVLVNEKTKTGKEVTVVYTRAGVLFPVNSQHEKAPVLSGPFDAAEGMNKISFWEKTGKSGGTFLSGTIGFDEYLANREQGQAPAPTPAPAAAAPAVKKGAGFKPMVPRDPPQRGAGVTDDNIPF